jgi:C-terminal processing protease CtpA/Prc
MKFRSEINVRSRFVAENRAAVATHYRALFRLKGRAPALIFWVLILSIVPHGFAVSNSYGQGVSPANATTNSFALREMFGDWLSAMKDAIKESYYDPKYHGIDLNARFDAARSSINKLDHDWQMFRVLAQIMMDFDDAHTSLILPPRKEHFDYGFTMQMFGADCLVTEVTKGSDAEKAGLEVGDKIVKISDIPPDRDSLWKLTYVLYHLAPTENLEITIKKANLPEKTLNIKARITSHKDYLEERKKRKEKEKSEPLKCTELTKEIIACKLFTFDVDKGDIDKMMKLVAGHAKLILDLRGNGGGWVTTEEYLTGYFFDHDVKILDLITRKKTEERVAKSKGKNAFTGDLVVLVDSDSASASEIFARVVQLEKRGKVIGDITGGFVMESEQVALVRYTQRFGYKTKAYPLFLNLSIGDIVMSDGGRLEKRGVVPDIAIIPKGSALKNKLDPIMAVAANSLGLKLSPEDAGKIGFLTQAADDPYPDDPQ